MDEKLQHIFKYYCSYGDRMNTTSMTNPKFFKFIRDAHILDTRVCPPDVDIVFNRACVRSAPGPKERTASPLRSTPVTNRLNYDRFVFAISELAVRKYQSDAAASLRQLVTLCVLPLYEKLRANPLFVEEIVQAGKETQVQQFAKAFLQKDVVCSAQCGVYYCAGTSLTALSCQQQPPPPHRSTFSTPTVWRCKASSHATPWQIHDETVR